MYDVAVKRRLDGIEVTFETRRGGINHTPEDREEFRLQYVYKRLRNFGTPH